jgi:hypothetical protein
MSLLVKELVKGLLYEKDYKKTVGIYAGGFKPPTKGHFEVLETALKQNPDIDEMLVYIGKKDRGTVSQEESKQIWDIYGKYLPLKVKYIESTVPPIKAVYNYAKENPEEEVLWVLGAREESEDDFSDISKRTKSITKYPNLELRTIVTKGGISGTAARNALKTTKEKFETFLPDVLSDEDKDEIWVMLTNPITEQYRDTNFDRVEYYKEYFDNLSPTEMEVKREGDNIVISNVSDKIQESKFINSTYLNTEDQKINKNQWVDIDNKNKYSDELINLVQIAYKKTPEGSFINTKKDIVSSEWLSIDFDEYPDLDATIFYRESRPNEAWEGKKIQGIGHDGSKDAIKIVLQKLEKLLSQEGIWVEASDALEHILYKMGVSYIKNEEEAQNIFPNTNLKMVGDRGKYERELDNGKKVKETIFGKPKLKKQSIQENASYSNHINYKQHIKDLTQDMIRQGMGIEPLPKVRFIHSDSPNAQDFFGKTAYYDPHNMEIVLYTEGRHPKDIVRSFAHEMIHHKQNLEGRLGNINTTNTNEDDELEDIEKEAYLNGNITFRNWTDSLNEKKTKDPFGINAYAMELGKLREDETEYQIYCDMDGVLADFERGYEELTGIDLKGEFKPDGEEFWDPIKQAGVKFWVGLKWMPGGQQLWDYIKPHNPKLLSAPSREESSRIGKYVWVKRKLPGTKLLLRSAFRKKEFANPNSILIDDRIKNIESWEQAGGIGIHHTSTENTIKELKKLGL